MILTPEEVVDLTHRQRPTAQAKALTAMGIDHRIRPDGTVLVIRATVEHLLTGAKAGKVKAPREIDWAAVHALDAKT